MTAPAVDNKLIDGTALAARVQGEVARRVAALRRSGVTPGLSVVLVGDDPASAVYVGAKERTCIELGMHGETIRLPATTTPGRAARDRRSAERRSGRARHSRADAAAEAASIPTRSFGAFVPTRTSTDFIR